MSNHIRQLISFQLNLLFAFNFCNIFDFLIVFGKYFLDFPVIDTVQCDVIIKSWNTCILQIKHQVTYYCNEITLLTIIDR